MLNNFKLNLINLKWLKLIDRLKIMLLIHVILCHKLFNKSNLIILHKCKFWLKIQLIYKNNTYLISYSWMSIV